MKLTPTFVKLMLTEILLSQSAAIYEEKNWRLTEVIRSNEGLRLDVRMGCEGVQDLQYNVAESSRLALYGALRGQGKLSSCCH